MKLRFVIQLFLVSIAIFFAASWWLENRQILSIGTSVANLQKVTVPTLTSLIELSSSARRASIKAIEYSMHGQEKNKQKAEEALQQLNQHFEQINQSCKASDINISQAQLTLLQSHIEEFSQLVHNYLAVSKGPSIDEVFDNQETIQVARRQLIHSFKPINNRLNSDQQLSASRLKSEARKISVKLIEISLRGNPLDKQKVNESIATFMDELQTFRKLTFNQDDAYQQIQLKSKQYLEIVNKSLNTINIRNQPIDKSYEQEKQLHQARRTLIHSLYPLIDSQYVSLQKVVESTDNSLEHAALIQKTSSLLFVLLAIVLGLILSKMIVRPIAKLNLAAKKVGDGDFETNVEVSSNNEIGQLAVAFNEMSNKLQSSKEHIEYMAYFDELTGLANRRFMLSQLESIIANNQRHQKSGAIFMLDLDRFKNINDSLGHLAGDQLLKMVADRLSGITRNENIVCRLGGDEFLILIGSLDSVNGNELTPAIQIAEKIQTSLSSPYQIKDNFYNVTPSIGVVLFPSSKTNTPEELLKQADAAMYQAKNEGGNRTAFYEQSLQEKVDERLYLEKELHAAFTNKELYLTYQPQCDMQGNIISVETLIRWHHKEHGQIPPPKFISIAEETGLINPLGEWIIEQACKDLNPFLNKSKKTNRVQSFSINVSAHQFQNPNFVSSVFRLLDKYQISYKQLTLELTETILLNNIDVAKQRMQLLSNAGIHLSLDDFGTGFSSLSYLSKLPLNEVKIDRSFLLDAEENSSSWAIIQATIDLAKALQLKTVAEGVEYSSQLEKLESIHCDLIQGYYFYKPLTFTELKSALK